MNWFKVLLICLAAETGTSLFAGDERIPRSVSKPESKDKSRKDDKLDLLIDGPLLVTVEFHGSSGSSKHEGYLMYLRDTSICYRVKPSGRLIRHEAAKGKVRGVTSADGENRWVLDPVAMVFTGPRESIKPIELSPLSRETREERLVLFTVLEELLEDIVGLDANGESKDPELIREAVKSYAKYIDANGLGREPTDWCNRTLNLLDKRAETYTWLRDVYQRMQRKKLATTEKLREEFEQARRWVSLVEGTEHMRDQERVWKGADQDDLFGTAIGSLLVLGFRGHLQEQRRKSIRADYERIHLGELARITEEGVGLWAKHWQAYLRARNEVRVRLYSDGARLFRHVDSDSRQKENVLLDGLFQKRDFAQVAEYYAKRVKAQPENPFLQARHCLSAALVPQGDRFEASSRALALARKCAAAARLLPANQIYDRARQSILVMACQIACRATDLEMSSDAWSQSYSPAAAYTVQLVDAFNTMKGGHEWRDWMLEQRAWGLMRSERAKEALDQALAIEPMRKHIPSFGINLARIYSSRRGRGDDDTAMKWLEHSVRLAGWMNIKELRSNPDFDSVRICRRLAFNRLTQVSFAWALDAKSGGLRIINHAPFPLTNLTIRARFLNASGKIVTATHPKVVPLLRPQEELLVPSVLKGGVLARGVRVSLESDQGRR
jgi:hypothetical protein